MTLLPRIMCLRGFSFDLATANLDEEKSHDFELEIVEVVGKLDRAELAHLETSAWVQRVGKRGGLALRGTERKVAVKPAFKQPARRLSLELNEQKGRRLKMTYEPSEERWITMRVLFDRSDEPLLHRFDVIQRERDGIVGAARVMTVSVPEELTIPDGDNRAGD